MKKVSFLIASIVALSLQGNAASIVTTSPIEILDDDRLLFEFYSKEIAKMDVETIQKHPEIVFRKSLVAYHLLGGEDSPQRIHYQLTSLRRDLEFVMYYVESSSKLFKAAKLQIEHIDYLLSHYPRNTEELLASRRQFFEERLKEWSTDRSLSGRDLRENVFLNIQNSPEVARSFFDFATIFTFEAEPILGDIQPMGAHLVGLVPQGNGQSVLTCELRYQVIRGGVIKKSTWELCF